MRRKWSRFVLTLSAQPCEVTQRAMRTPIAAILSLPTQIPRLPSTRSAVMPYSATVRISTSSSFGDVLAHVAVAFAEVEDRVADDLAGAVVGDVAAAGGLVEADAVMRERLGRGEEVGRHRRRGRG